jgi:NADPH-dependent curcumin reductase CurA
MTDRNNRAIHLKRRPVGMPQESDFELVESSLAAPGAGEVMVRNLYISVDPYMRGRMIDREGYVEAFQLGEPLAGGCVGQVIESHNDNFQVGDYVLGSQGWREYYVSDGEDLRKIDPGKLPVQAYLGVLGMTGMTAYVGLLDIGQPQAGETVFVSAASGAVGSIVCQIAKIKGCRVVGSAGSDQKIDWLINTIGVDSAFNYKKVDDLTSTLGTHCPDGIDIYFENVGGDHLEATLEHMNLFGRIPACGMISQYNAIERQPGPRNLISIVGNRVLLKGFIVSDHYDQLPQFYQDMQQWISEEKITWEETIVDGLDNAPKAFIDLFTGENIGKMLVKVH